MEGELLAEVALLVEGIFGQNVTLQLPVARPVGRVTIDEEAAAEGRSRCSTETIAGPLEDVATDEGVDRAELHGAILLHRLHVAADQCAGHLLRPVEDGDAPQLGHHSLDRRLAGGVAGAVALLRALLLPVVVRPAACLLGLHHGVVFAKDGRVVGRPERLVAVEADATRIGALALGMEAELDRDVVLEDEPCAVVGAAEILLDLHEVDVVQIDVFRHIQADAADEVGGVERDVEVASEAKRFGVEGHEAEVGTALAIDLDGVREIVLIKGGAEGG